MTDSVQWQLANDRYLVRRIDWLRRRLEGCATGRSGKPVVARGHQAEGAALSALEILGQRLSLSAFEQNVLLLCAAAELDARIPELCARALGEPHRSYPTFALAIAIFDDPAWEAISPARPLRRLRLLDVNQPGATALTAAALRADERIVHFIKGLNVLDERLAPLLLPVDVDTALPLPPSQQAVADRIIAELANPSGRGVPVVELAGADTAGKQLVAGHVASHCELEVVRLSADLIPSDAAELETLLALWEREQLLLPIALYIDAGESDARWADRPSSPLGRFIARAGGLVFLDVPEPRSQTLRPRIAADVTYPTRREQHDGWQREWARDDQFAAELAGQFNLNAPEIVRLARTHTGDAAELWEACRRATRPRLETLAQRIDARATWNDLVLPDEELAQLHAIAAQVRQRGRVYDDWGFAARHNRGLGISVLFAGESGTGKTMAAEVIARELRLDLFRIDLSAVVNKYVGETEKNLRRLFDAAEGGGAILLFDEADALFGKRTEVKDSHDRYANLEVNYLLQRMESYRGMAILATNLKSSLDRAFLRRLRFVVDFPVPEAAQRRTLWSHAFPVGTPLADLDYDRLARLNVTGGNIHTIALNAAFAAAERGAPVGMQELATAMKQEYRKLQKPIAAADLRFGEIEATAR